MKTSIRSPMVYIPKDLERYGVINKSLNYEYKGTQEKQISVFGTKFCGFNLNWVLHAQIFF